MEKKYDYLIVGSGLFGSIFAYEAKKRGKNCLIVEKRNHIGGNIYCENINGINVHKYGAHIFHTSNRKVWDYVNQFAEFNNYVNSPVAVYKDELYNLPFNMNTFSKMWGIKTPAEAKEIIEKQKAEFNIENPQNLEEQALSLIGKDVYEKLVKGYTEKQWGRSCTELPASIIRRLPVRYIYDNNYFNDRWQGIPIGGYNQIIEKMLDGIDVLLETSYADYVKENDISGMKVVYTGNIDEYFDYKLGALQYRTVRFETEVMPDVDNYQGNAVVNYTEREVPYTRIIEHKHFEFSDVPGTVISKEFSSEWSVGIEPYSTKIDFVNKAGVTSTDLSLPFTVPMACTNVYFVLNCSYVDGTTGRLPCTMANYTGTAIIDGVGRTMLSGVTLLAGYWEVKIENIKKDIIKYYYHNCLIERGEELSMCKK